MAHSSVASKYVLIAAGVFAVPVVIALVLLSGGAIEPHLPGSADTWNIQYLLHFVIALIAALLVVRYRALIGKAWCSALVVWNCAWAVLALYAAISLWGEIH